MKNEMGLYDVMVERSETIDELEGLFADCLYKAREEGICELTVIKMVAAFDSMMGLCRTLVGENYEALMDKDELERAINEIREKFNEVLKDVGEELI